MTMNRLINKEWRLYLVVFVLLALFILLIVRMLMIQVVDINGGLSFLQNQGESRILRIETVPAYRGMIKDRNGVPLAVSTPVMSIWVNPKNLDISEQQITALSKYIEMPSELLKKKLKLYKDKQFVYLKRQLSPMLAEEILALKIKGLYGQEEYKRYYPAGETAAHVVGYTSIDGVGQEGVEKSYDKLLQGREGSKQVVQDLFHRTIKDVRQIQEAQSGKDLELTIDMRIQYLAYKALKSEVKKHNADGGSVVVLDVESGDVLAMASQPAYNPNDRSDMKFEAIRNRAVTDLLEPGSTMKPIVVVTALESGKYKPETIIDARPGHMKVGRKTLYDHSNYGVIDVTKVITKSSQVGITKITLSLDQQDVIDTYKRFGISENLEVNYPGVSLGLIPERKRWSDLDRATFSFGHGVSTTTLQLARAYNVFANEGVRKPVALIKTKNKAKAERVFDKKIGRQMIAMLDTVAGPDGTAKLAQTDAYNVGGKTGTTHKLGPNGYESNKYMSIFAGFAPVESPKIVAVVVIDNPKGKVYYGGAVAGPVFSEVASGALRIMNVIPDDALLLAKGDAL